MQFVPSLSQYEARAKVKKLYEATKGRVVYNQNAPNLWVNGTESCTFNVLEEFAHSQRPKTPALGCEIPDGLLRENLVDPKRDVRN
jgi:DNA polymerase gamma 1